MRLLASDLSRARQTAVIIAAQCGWPAYQVAPELREQSWGTYQRYRGFEEFVAEHGASWRGQTPPGGESALAMSARVGDFLGSLIDEATPGEILVIVSHIGPIQEVVRAAGFRQELIPGHCVPYSVRYWSGVPRDMNAKGTLGYEWESENDAQDLPDEGGCGVRGP